MTPLAHSGSDHDSSMVVDVIPRDVRFWGFVGTLKRSVLFSVEGEEEDPGTMQVVVCSYVVVVAVDVVVSKEVCGSSV